MIEDLVIKNFEMLTTTDKHIWQYIKENKKRVYKLNLKSLAQKCNVSTSAIVRFSKRISLQGFSELKYLLRQEDEPEKFNGNIFEQYQIKMDEFFENITKKDLRPVCRLLSSSKKIFVYGTGTLQRTIAQEIRRLFLTINIPIFFIEGVDELSALTASLTQDDVVILITLKGSSDNAILFAKNLKANGIPFISIVERVDNEISRLSDQNIFIDPIELKLNPSRQLSIKDPYFIMVSVLFIRMNRYLCEIKENTIDKKQNN